MNAAPELILAARQCAGLFRLGRDVEAASEMVELFTRLMPLFSEEPAKVQQKWLLLLTVMLAHQEKRDVLGMADYLEFELVELLGLCP
ncbi:hypothetical protein QN382_00115 [Pseudomonas sp. 10B1]|uniref:hypothetical protein n=1 Tax=unclassified Pseudomonas TaxID=196821 RepID=UPI002AB50827|nr:MULTISPECIES: hypothetical protein [unclassified Pseudomonas]MDY7560755.1 hypothetical protein [Pseudomonas sp. AB6]MEA9978125.1 hypothetical protein [Pseudomonas sp. RTS4]MEA9997141.1 hypothetical protein [Pseudomonas sp. AA4]MEB0087330.1 hypothetical protein [Pseudomonas sp. RTI1]MEB0128117.1 hypothetical protein [Pseudomonas sp. CCC1.2]